MGELSVTREGLVSLLNEDLAREYQGMISCIMHSQTIKGPSFMAIAAELKDHAANKLAHALTIAGQIAYLGGMPIATSNSVQLSANPQDMLRLDLANERQSIANYRQRVVQCEALGEFAIAEHIRCILVEEQDHQVSVASALGVDVPNANAAGTPLDEHSRINAGIGADTHTWLRR
jgi:bacterioferritin